MHELHLFRQVVQAVEERFRTHPGARVAVIRLDVGSHSHLASHTATELQTTFQFAAKGTAVEHAELDIHVQPTKGQCQSCKEVFARAPETYGCPHCLSGYVAWDDQPELRIAGIEILERKPCP